MPWYNEHTCDCCKKTFITDNAWIWCEGPELTVRARFCSQKCRTNYLVARGWYLDELLRLVPPTKNGKEGEEKTSILPRLQNVAKDATEDVVKAEAEYESSILPPVDEDHPLRLK